MKNSAWDHKLWSEKLDQLRLTEEADTTWQDMKQLLDENLPEGINTPWAKPSRINKANLFFIIAVIIAIIAVFVAIVYHSTSTPIRNLNTPKNNHSLSNLQHSIKKEIKNSAEILDTASMRYVSKILVIPSSENTSSSSTGVNPGLKRKFAASKSTKKLIGESEKALVITRSAGNNSQLVTMHTTKELDQESEVKSMVSVPIENEQNGKDTVKKKFDNLTLPTTQPKANSADILPSSINVHTYYSNSLVEASEATQTSAFISTPASKKEARITKQKIVKQKSSKSREPQPFLSLGLSAGTSLGRIPNQFLGADASLKINNHIRINPGLVLHQNRQISGNIIHPSYYKPDSIAPFSISDTRKIDVLSLPLTIQVKATNSLSVNAGLAFNILQKQYGATTKISTMPDKRDTLNQSLFVNRSLQQTQFLHANLGLHLGVGYEYRGFKLTAMYVNNFKSYQVTSPLGSYSTSFQAFQLGVGYQFKPFKKGKKNVKKKNLPPQH